MLHHRMESSCSGAVWKKARKTDAFHKNYTPAGEKVNGRETEPGEGRGRTEKPRNVPVGFMSGYAFPVNVLIRWCSSPAS